MSKIYKHDMYQACIAGILISQTSKS